MIMIHDDHGACNSAEISETQNKYIGGKYPVICSNESISGHIMSV